MAADFPTNRDYVNGAQSIVNDYLRLRRGERFLIVCDETGCDMAEYVSSEARSLGAVTDVHRYDTELQSRIEDGTPLPLDLRTAIRSAHCILNCLSSKTECTSFRKRVIRIGQKYGTRIAHVPGLSVDHLVTAFQRPDFSRMTELNTLLVRILFFGNDCELHTVSKGGIPHTLSMSLGWTERLPAQSGEVTEASWCNIPAGETYIAPMEGSAEGTIVVNASMLGEILDDEVLISFHGGTMTEWRTGSSRIQAILEEFAETWQHDPNWNKLCELGFGLNDRFHEPTGCQILDEKMIGTCHVAIGESTNFGGKIDSEIHEDFVTVAPTVIVDGLPMMKDGKFSVDESDLQEDLLDRALVQKDFADRQLSLSIGQTIVQSGKLCLGMNDARSRPFLLQVGNDIAASRVCSFVRHLEDKSEFRLDEVTRAFPDAVSLLGLLSRYDLLRDAEYVQ